MAWSNKNIGNISYTQGLGEEQVDSIDSAENSTNGVLSGVSFPGQAVALAPIVELLITEVILVITFSSRRHRQRSVGVTRPGRGDRDQEGGDQGDGPVCYCLWRRHHV